MEMKVFVCALALCVWCVSGDACTERVVFNNTWGRITDGPEDYKEEVHCEWLIEATKPGQVINLEFVSMMTECSYDQVMVYDGVSYGDRLLGAFSGDTLPHPMYALSGHMLVYFYSDYNYMKEGFEAVYSVTDCPFNCSGSNGNCDLPTHTCVCNPGYTGESCQVEFCPGNCHGHGVCDASLQRCVCEPHYAGYGCSLPVSHSNISLSSGARWFDIMPADTGFRARTSHAGVFIDSEKCLYLFGGNTLHSVLDEFIKYDFTQSQWVEVHKQLPWPKGRHSHAMCEYGSKIYLFGGVLDNGHHSNELWVYDIKANLWTDKTKESVSMVTPTAVASHTLTVADGSVYLFGGRTEEGQFVSDMYRLRLNTSDLHWTRVTPRGGMHELRRLAGHSAVFHQESLSILVFGGFMPDTARFPSRTNTLHVFHIKEEYWTELEYKESKLSPMLKLEHHGKPQLRALHGAVILGNYLVVYGGNSHIHHDLEVCYDDGIYFYHLGCHAWVERSKIEGAFDAVTKSVPQRGRFSMVVAAAFGNTLLISGGYRGNVLGDLVAYRVPVSVARPQDSVLPGNQSTHCYLHSLYENCKYDSECIWCMKRPELGTPGCVARSQRQHCSGVIRDGYCQSICSTLSDCGACTVQGQGVSLHAHSPRGYWYNKPCAWCVKEAKCISRDGPHDPPNVCDQANATESGIVGWWGGRSMSLIDLSQCRLHDYPAGLHYLAFNYPQDFDHPDEVYIIRHSGSDFHVSPKLRKRDIEYKDREYQYRIRGYIHPLASRGPSGDKHLKLILEAVYADTRLYVSTDDKEENKELVATLGALTYDVQPANKSGDQPVFANESRGFKYYTEIQISRKLQNNQNSRVSVAWTGAVNEDRIYRQKISSEFLEPYNTNNCSHYDTCLACMMDVSCGWCQLNRSCVQRSDKEVVCHRENEKVELVTNPEQCSTCEDRIGCEECLQYDSACEWVVSNMHCTRRGRFSNAQRHVSQCAAPCHRRTSCQLCISVGDECVWCENTKACFPFLVYISRYAYGGCNDWVDLSGNRTCHDCSRFSTAASCLREFRCGWCGNVYNPTLGKCIEGDFSGPSGSVNCTRFLETSHNVSGVAAWSYGKLPNVDECSLGLHDCHANATCINTYTAYECMCDRGFIGNGRDVCDRTCYHDCIHGTCSQARQYECLCETGWTGPDCNTNCGCHNHSSCSKGQGQCDECQDLTTGKFCQLCVPGAYGNATTPVGCTACQCNGHSDPSLGFCDMVTGQCFCTDNTEGDQCEKCQHGYYGDPRDGGKCYLKCESRSMLTAVTEGALGSYAGSGVSEDSIYCLWILTVHPALDSRGADLHVTPTISLTMETSLNVACTQDTVYVYDGIPPLIQGVRLFHASHLLAAFCGSGLQQEVTVVAGSGYLTVLFQGNRLLAGGRTTGFNASYHVNSCPNHCHDNRSCDSGVCLCASDVSSGGESAWFGGVDCGLEICPRNCGVHGHCDRRAGLCHCEPGFGGLGCEDNLQPLTSIAVTLETDPRRSQGDLASLLPRMGHTLSVCGENSHLYLFGGFSVHWGALNDLWYLDLSSNDTWRQKTETGGEHPAKRYFHSMFCHSSQLYVYGGLSDTLKPLSDVWVYDLNMSNWTRVQPTVAMTTAVPALAGHTTTYTKEGKAFIIGGFSDHNYFSSKTYQFDVTTLEWKDLHTTGYPLIGLYGHTTVYHPASHALYVYGGYKFHLDKVTPSSRLYTLDLQRKRWSELPSQPGNKPEPRFSHAAVTTDEYMIVYGGQKSHDQVTSDLMIYRYACNSWTSIVYHKVVSNHTLEAEDLSLSHLYSVFTGVPLPPLTASAAAYVNGHVYIFGGMHSVTSGRLYKVTFPEDICSIHKDLASCVAAVGCSACFIHHTNTTVCYSRNRPAPHSCGSSPGLVSNFSSPVCDGGLIQARKCQDANSCGECLANWPVHRGQGHLCKWCTKCKTGKCIPVNSDCDTENPCSTPQASVNSSESCDSLTCQASNCQACVALGDCVWTYKLRRKEDGSGFDFSKEPGFPYNCISREDLKSAPEAISQTCPKSCTEHRDCTACLSSTGGECVWSGELTQCLPLHSLPLFCAAGRCGHVLQGGKSLCPAACSLYTRCDVCLMHPQCGWCTKEGANGDGSCVEGGLNSQFDSGEYRADWYGGGELVWAYIQCPLENECTNGHHDCDTNEECIDMVDGFRCQCKDGYNRTHSSQGVCQPVCDQGCVHGNCVAPNRCECHFGYVGDNCSLECLCNGHSNCMGVTMEMRQICVECHNNTRGAQCEVCEPLYVGNPVNGGMCLSCTHYCNEHSDVCLSTDDYNRSQANKLPLDRVGVLSWLTQGPSDSQTTLCVHCGDNSLGLDCSQCQPGYFRLDSKPKTEPCSMCECHGHSSSCHQTSGVCESCQNNTESDCKSDQETEEACWQKQCSKCIDKYEGTPTHGHQCYLEMSVKNGYCYESHTGNKCCFDPYTVADCTTKPTVLQRGKTLFYAIQPQYVNVDIRIVLDVTVGGLDVYLSPFEDAWVVYNDENTWEHVISIDPKYLQNISPLPTDDRAKRASASMQGITYSDKTGQYQHSVWSVPKPIVLQGETAKVKREAESVNTSSDFYDSWAMKLVDTHAQGMFSLKSIDYNETLLIVRDVQNRLVIQLVNTKHQFSVSKFYMILHGRGNAVTNDTYGSVFFRQDHPRIDLFVFFAVFFAAFFMKLAIIVLIWKVKQSYDTQRSRQQRQKEMRHMASRPFSKCSVVIEPPSDFTRENPTGGRDDSDSNIQLMKVDNAMGARSKVLLTNGTSNSAFRTARYRIGTLGGSSGRHSNEAGMQHTINNIHPLALEALDDGVAAVGTVLFQMPGGIQAPVGLAFGSSLITTRVFFPSFCHRSTSIPRQGSTSV